MKNQISKIKSQKYKFQINSKFKFLKLTQSVILNEASGVKNPEKLWDPSVVSLLQDDNRVVILVIGVYLEFGALNFGF